LGSWFCFPLVGGFARTSDARAADANPNQKTTRRPLPPLYMEGRRGKEEIGGLSSSTLRLRGAPAREGSCGRHFFDVVVASPSSSSSTVRETEISRRRLWSTRLPLGDRGGGFGGGRGGNGDELFPTAADGGRPRTDFACSGDRRRRARRRIRRGENTGGERRCFKRDDPEVVVRIADLASEGEKVAPLNFIL